MLVICVAVIEKSCFDFYTIVRKKITTTTVHNQEYWPEVLEWNERRLRLVEIFFFFILF